MMKTYRNEWKYHCSNTDTALVAAHVGAVLQPDVHAHADGKYGVHSLYFDDLANACVNDTRAGVESRFKYRIRYYDHDPSALRLERKEKLGSGCRKLSCPLTRAEYDALVSADVAALAHDTQKPLLRAFCLAILKRHFTPRVIVDYERIAYTEPISNVRVTIDTNIAVSRAYDRFLEGDYLRIPLLDQDEHVLEVKFDSILPGYIRRSINQIPLRQQTFSKYVLGFEKLRSNK